MEATTPYHAGELAVQARAGRPQVSERNGRTIGREIPPAAAAFLAAQPLLVLGASDADGAVWCTMLTGAPGFARALGPSRARIDALAAHGDPLADVLRPGAQDVQVGLLGIAPRTRRRMRLNGTAAVDAHGLTVDAEQVYANCPKYIQVRDGATDAPTASDGSGGNGDAPPRVTRATTLADADVALLRAADTFFVATAAGPGAPADASHRGGSPGFLQVHDERRLSWPDYVGNAMYMTLGNLEAHPPAGLLVVDWERGDALHLTGTGTTDWDPERAAEIPGAQRVVDFAVDQVVRRPAALPLRWTLEERSRVNPPAPRPGAGRPRSPAPRSGR